MDISKRIPDDYALLARLALHADCRAADYAALLEMTEDQAELLACTATAKAEAQREADSVRRRRAPRR